MRCSSNNRARTVLDGFLEGVDQWGLPSRVRSDRGGENVLVSVYMNGVRGINRGSMLMGKSTANQRIERHWSDVWTMVAKKW